MHLNSNGVPQDTLPVAGYLRNTGNTGTWC